MGGHSKLEFIDIKTNISSILSYTGLTRTEKKHETNNLDKLKTTKQNLNNKKIFIGSVTAGSGNLQNAVFFH